MNSEREKEQLVEELRRAITECLQDSTRIQQIIHSMNQRGFQLNVWMMIGILLEEMETQPIVKKKPSIHMTCEDIEWLKSLKISLKESV